MTKNHLIKTLSGNLIFTFLISTLLTRLLLEIIYHPSTSGAEGGTVTFIMTVGSFFWNLLLTITALTTFLNLKTHIRQNFAYRACSFFLLPALLVFSVYISVYDPNSLFSFGLSIVSFFVIHAIFFVIFNIKINKSEKRNAIS